MNKLIEPTFDEEHAASIRDRVLGSNPSAWQAYLFSRLSVQTPLAAHERSYLEVLAVYPEPSTDHAGLSQVLQSAKVPFWVTKARDLAKAAEVLDSVMVDVALEPSDKRARLILAQALPGLGLAKASFMLMLLGRMDVACFDVHMVRLLKLRQRPSSQKQYAYAESKLRRLVGRGTPLGLAQWAIWTTHMGIQGTGHDVYFATTAP